MKPIGEEQQEVASALNDRAVVDYLLQHPEFFIRNAAQVEHLRVPHPVRGTISLVEWHMMRARNHIHVLEENMSLLMEQAVANESLFQRLLQLDDRLMQIADLLFAKQAERGMTLVLVTHDLDTLAALATRVAVLSDGRILACGPLDEIMMVQDPFIERFFHSERSLAALARGRAEA